MLKPAAGPPRPSVCSLWAVVVGCIALCPGKGTAQSALRAWSEEYWNTEESRLPAVAVKASYNRTALLRSDGRIFCRGENQGYHYGGPATPANGLLMDVPDPPAGLVYTDFDLGPTCGLGLLSDGTVVPWGSISIFPSAAVLLTVPPLPVGRTYTRVAAAFNHALLLRSDGALIATGDNYYGQLAVPTVPPGVSVVDIVADGSHSAALLSDGTLRFWGDNSLQQGSLPPAPPGLSYTGVSVSPYHTLALRSDGQVVAVGWNMFGQCNVPPLPGI